MIKLLYLILSLQLGYLNKDIERTQLGVWEECVCQDILFCDIVVQQSTTETFNGNTGVGKTRNNLFGFRNKSGYLYFKSIRESLAYYKSWQDKNYSKYLETNPPGDYYDFIWWVGFKDGKCRSKAGKKYINYLKKIKI